MSCEEIARKMDALGLWKTLLPCNWAIRPHGTVLPYFCLTLLGDEKVVKARFLLLEGWQTLQSFVHLRADASFGFYSSPTELPHFEVIVLHSGEVKVFRYDTGYAPREISEREDGFLARLLWEAYGFMMRLESDPSLPLRFADERAVFGRVETAPGVWEDRPLEIPSFPHPAEEICLDKAQLKAAQDLPFVAQDVLHVDFGLVPEIMTKEPRPRSVYELKAFDPAAKSMAFAWRVSLPPDGSLKGLWESVPGQILKSVIARGRVPGEIKVVSGRVFRMLRPLGLHLPFKLSLHDALSFA